MRYIKQFGIILAVSFAGEILNAVIPLPIPASIYGLVLMLALLHTRMVRPEAVRRTAYFLIEIMPMMFIPAAVGLLESWSLLQPVWLPFCVITVVSTVAVMVIAGHATQAAMALERRKITSGESR